MGHIDRCIDMGYMLPCFSAQRSIKYEWVTYTLAELCFILSLPTFLLSSSKVLATCRGLTAAILHKTEQLDTSGELVVLVDFGLCGCGYDHMIITTLITSLLVTTFKRRGRAILLCLQILIS